MKAGDKVKCIDNTLLNDYLNLGEVYTILDGSTPGVLRFDIAGYIFNLSATRFELVEEEELKYSVDDVMLAVKEVVGNYSSPLDHIDEVKTHLKKTKENEYKEYARLKAIYEPK